MNVADCVAGVSSLRSEKSYGVFNLGVNDFCEVRDSIRWICDEMGLDPVVTFSGGTRGWIGDNPFIWLDVSRAKSYGWEAGSSIEFSVRETVRWLLKHPEVVTG
jgi:UDP-glucose 4-epimerase